MSAPARGRWSSKALNIAISLVAASTRTWARTAPLAWSIALKKCSHRPLSATAPRADLPSTAITRRAVCPSGPLAARVATQALSTASNTSGSTAPAARRRVDNAGVERPSPNATRTRSGRSAHHCAAPAYSATPAVPAAINTDNSEAKPIPPTLPAPRVSDHRKHLAQLDHTTRGPQRGAWLPARNKGRYSSRHDASRGHGRIRTPPRSRDRHACAPLHPYRRVVTTPRRQPENELALGWTPTR